MKLAFVIVLFSSQVFAGQAPIFSISCEGKNQHTNLKLQAKSFINYTPAEMQLRDLTVSMTDGGKTVTGRTSYIETDENYKPTRYTGYKRFSLNKLTEVSRFSPYSPFGCSVQVMFPEPAGNQQARFFATAMMNCDQSGGKIDLECFTKKTRD